MIPQFKPKEIIRGFGKYQPIKWVCADWDDCGETNVSTLANLFHEWPAHRNEWENWFDGLEYNKCVCPHCGVEHEEDVVE
jgi:hypothetical protein